MVQQKTDWPTTLYRVLGIMVVLGSALYWLTNLEARMNLSDKEIQYHKEQIASMKIDVRALNETLQAIDKKLGILIDRQERQEKNNYGH